MYNMINKIIPESSLNPLEGGRGASIIPEPSLNPLEGGRGASIIPESSLNPHKGGRGASIIPESSLNPHEGGRGAFARFRQFRLDAATRDRYAEIKVTAADFIYPYFILF